MTESIGVTTWHLGGGLGEADHQGLILGSLDTIANDAGGDVILLTEAARTTAEHPEEQIRDIAGATEEAARRLGYNSFQYVPYDDDEQVAGKPEHFQRYMMVIGRNVGILIARLGSRNGFDLSIASPSLKPGCGISAVAGHFEDRSDTLRLPMARAAWDRDPDLIIGRLNALHGEDRLARNIRLVNKLGLTAFAKQLPADGQGKIKRVQSLVNRNIEMASGQTLDFMNSRGFEDTDPKHQPTHYFAGGLRTQLDYIMARSGLVEATSLPRRRLAGSQNAVVSALVR